jgi:glutamate synthase (NADPH/NADH) small chain
VDFVCDTRIGRDITVDDLLREHDAVYLATGAGVDAPANLPGEDLRGVVAAGDFLVRANASTQKLLPDPNSPRASSGTAIGPLSQGPRVVVLGGSDAGLDAMRAALRLGAASVTCIFEGDADGLHGRQEEHRHAREEGVVFRFGVRAVAFEGDAAGRVTGVRCRRLGWTDSERQDRIRVFGMADSDFVVPADLVIVAIGYVPDPLLTDATPGLHTGEGERLHADRKTGLTSRAGVFAGGDGVHGPGLVVTAMAAGRRAAAAIDDYLRVQMKAASEATGLLKAPARAENNPRRRPWSFSRGRAAVSDSATGGE